MADSNSSKSRLMEGLNDEEIETGLLNLEMIIAGIEDEATQDQLLEQYCVLVDQWRELVD